MAGRVSKVNASSAVVPVESAWLGPLRVGPVFETRIEDSLVDPVELFLRDEEGVVLGPNLEVRLRELDRSSLTELHGDEKPPGNWVWKAEQ